MKTLHAIMHGARDLRMEERTLDESALGDREMLVRTEVSALSTGTDLGNYMGRSTEVPGAPRYPRPVGYSNAGRIVRTGSGVTRFSEGQRVFSLRPHLSAFVVSEDDILTPIPGNVPPEQASLAYLTQLGLAALQQARFESGESVAVIGLGVIGLASVALARCLGGRVTAMANDPIRGRLAAQLGADTAHPSAGSIDVVILTANTWDAYRTAMEIARLGGRISVLGFPGRAQPAPDFNPLAPEWLYRKQLSIIGAGRGSDVRSNLTSLLDRMASGELNLDPVISHRLPATRMREAYELALAHSKELTAAVFDWRSP